MTSPLLTAELDLPSGPLRLRLDEGDAVLLDGPDAGAAVAALTGIAPGSAADRVLLAGRRLDGRPHHARVARGLVLLGDAPVADDVSVLDHLAAIAGLRRARALLEGLPLLAGRGADPAGILSGGERRVLAWGRAAALEPLVVVLDRATAGLDAAVLTWADGVVAAWRAQGTGLVVRPHGPHESRWVT